MQPFHRDQRRPLADHVRLSDLEAHFVCQACGNRGDLRPDFNWGRAGSPPRIRSSDHARGDVTRFVERAAPFITSVPARLAAAGPTTSDIASYYRTTAA